MIGDIKNTQTLELSEENIKEIIKEHLKNNGYELVGNIDFKLKKEITTDGFGPTEIDIETLLFKGTTIEVKKI